ILYPILRVWRQLPFIALIPLFFIWFGLSLSQSEVLPIVAMALFDGLSAFEIGRITPPGGHSRYGYPSLGS
ncbi:MAG: hypothetical protein WBX25_30060, partial [Rhodomicrobium sp.]